MKKIVVYLCVFTLLVFTSVNASSFGQASGDKSVHQDPPPDKKGHKGGKKGHKGGKKSKKGSSTDTSTPPPK